MTAVLDRSEPIAIDGERPIDACKRLCRAPNVILDCGAGRGWFANICRAFYPTATIYSCEPTTVCFEALEESTRGRSINCRKIAVGAENGTATMNLASNDESGSLLAPPDEGHPLWEPHRVVGQEEVQVKTIDQWIADEGIEPCEVSILKLDLQGAELLAIQGAKNVLRHVELVVSEVWLDPGGYQDCPLLGEVREELSRHGLEMVALYTHPSGLWGDAVFRRTKAEIRLNIGAGETVIAGFTAIDRKFGTEAYPLNYADDSVEEIRCSHMLEHLDFEQVQEALKEWHRVLKPGGRLRISVPDVDKVIASKPFDENWRFHLMGGQNDPSDYHKAAFDDELLRAHFDAFGFENVQPWHSPNTDTAAHPCSLNLEGFKRKPETLKIKAVMSVPRVGWNDAWVSICSALKPFGIPVETFNGVFWGQCMQRSFQNAVVDGVDWLLCIDYDSMITAEHVKELLAVLNGHPEIDALAALQARRGGEEFPLLTIAGQNSVDVNGEPIKVATAHFGLTLIRTKCLADVAKPWFKSEPDSEGNWGDGRMDDDIWFWHQWRKAGKNVYVAPDVKIGHLQLMVSDFDDDMKPRHTHVAEWRKANKQ